MLKRIVTIQDISCFGKCSSTVALPIISAMGVETAVIPTAVLSTHTGGFTGYTFRDLTADIPQITAHWKSLNLHFDGIYTGYLGSREQINMVIDFIDLFADENTQVVVDPVMGDNGKFYAGFTPDFVLEMKRLCQKADVIVPNLTEAHLLLDQPYVEIPDEQEIHTMLQKLTEFGCKSAVITGVRYPVGQHGASSYNKETGTFYSTFRKHVPDTMHGTGDIFASVLSGALIRGASLEKAVYAAVNFTTDAIEATVDDLHNLPHDQAPWYGVEFETCMDKLIQYTKDLT